MGVTCPMRSGAHRDASGLVGTVPDGNDSLANRAVHASSAVRPVDPYALLAVGCSRASAGLGVAEGGDLCVVNGGGIDPERDARVRMAEALADDRDRDAARDELAGVCVAHGVGAEPADASLVGGGFESALDAQPMLAAQVGRAPACGQPAERSDGGRADCDRALRLRSFGRADVAEARPTRTPDPEL